MMSATPVRWVVIVVAALLLVGMLGWARGEEHHHGDDVGSLTSYDRVVAPGGQTHG
jgi:hypothetical protein